MFPRFGNITNGKQCDKVDSLLFCVCFFITFILGHYYIWRGFLFPYFFFAVWILLASFLVPGQKESLKKKSFPFPIQISLWRINLSRRYQKEQRHIKMHHVRLRQQLRIPVLWGNGCDSDAPPCGSPAPLCFTWFVSCRCVKLAPKAGLWVI